MRTKMLLSAAVLALGLSGCVSSGATSLKDENKETIATKVSEGMTGDEVRTNLGDPTNVSYTDGGKEIWTYEFMEGQMTAQSFIPVVSMFSSGVEGTKKQLVILFDEELKVERYTMSSQDVESKSGIIKQ